MSKQQEDGKEFTEHDNFVDYTEPPSLESIAIVCTAVRLWSDPENVHFDTLNNLHSFSELKERVLNKLKSLILPDLLKIKISNVIEPIGLQLCETNYYLPEMYSDFRDIHKIGGSVYYTMEGVIDTVKSLKEVINNEDQVKDISSLYELACKYCLEENISYLWQNMSSEKKKKFYNAYYGAYRDHIVDYWTAYLENELQRFLNKITSFGYDVYDSNQSIYQNMTSMSVFVGNIFALKYFWKLLTEQEKNINMEYWINLVLKELRHNISNVNSNVYQQYNPFADILFFLLSKTNDQQKKYCIFHTHSEIILKTLFFCWPWQRFFLPTIRMMFDYLNKDVYVGIMSDITVVIRNGRTTGDLVREIWHLSPIRLKNSLSLDMEVLLWNLLEVNDTKTIDVIISNIPPEERRDIALNIINYNDFSHVILSGKVTFLDTLITKLLPMHDDITRMIKMRILEYKREISFLIISNDIPIVDAWLNWIFPSENEIKHYKKEILNPMKIYISLIRLNDYECVNTFLKWRFETEEDITSFKKTFVQKGNFLRCFNLLIEMSNDYETGWDRFERFINHSLTCSEEISQFKKLYLKSVPTFLKRGNLTFATHYLNWCCNSLDEVNRYKNNLLFSKKGIGMLLYRWHHTLHFGLDSFRSRLKWFYPLSTETIDKLKSLEVCKFIGFCDSYAPERQQAFIYLLDCLEWKSNSRGEGEILDSTDAKIINRILMGKDINGEDTSDSSYNYDSDGNNFISCEDDDIYDLLYY
ncbi:uncharacterized protein [Parasteatoda tepidariorum]|uniref:uncharacterized protein n=1 Tax=Parasteatoda tepidariorum TaxID=114398 RepID=UPI001C717D21|nr:uncharacterized protein LOC122270197 [Parasteatoda tepidariorum]